MLKLKESIFDLLLYVVWQLLLLADQLRVLRMPSLLHDSGARALECLLELVDTSVSHWQLLVLLDLLRRLRCDTVDGGPSGVHLRLH